MNGDSLASTGQGFLGHNMFAYCNDNPARYADYGGNAPGDLFDSAYEAAVDFANYYNGQSIAQNVEYASYIYRVEFKETRIWWMPTTFLPQWAQRYFGSYVRVPITVTVTKYTYRACNPGGTTRSKPPINWLWRDEVVAYVHTHGAYMAGVRSDEFSPTDKELGRFYKVPIYVATPAGTLRRYDPSDGSDLALPAEVPFDPNHPER